MSEAVAEAPPQDTGNRRGKRSTKPGEPAPEAKREDVKRVPYPGLNADAEGKTTTKLKEYPTDFDSRKHVQLRPPDFENEAPLYEHRAKELRARADKYDKAAVLARTMGSVEERKNAKKLIALQEKMQMIREELIKGGHDPDKMFAGLMAARQAASA
jgi:hypothetical protein